MSALELKIPPVALVLLTGAGMGIVSAVAPSLAGAVPYGDVVALALAGVGGVVAALGVVSFRRAGTTVNPTQPQASSALVCGGVYRFSRNPMYLGFLLALLAWAVWLANILALAWVPAFVLYMNRFQIVPEEKVLAARFGAAFAAYRQRVRRWV